MTFVYMKSPKGDEIKEVQANTEALTPLMAAGWIQVPPPSTEEKN